MGSRGRGQSGCVLLPHGPGVREGAEDASQVLPSPPSEAPADALTGSQGHTRKCVLRNLKFLFPTLAGKISNLCSLA